ncbi:UDP-N-acetylmuramoyl-L-alanyl-D-glutamate--2,6-diaminopimelate ligase [Chromatiales bacterium (ex Bugula neritina AB1)]|nr:UDP-N-acetylmuramoyl-L-alanyl-D-glutamate--2,6-diaminopimelate ligase [Chromatiales bacterium (ex Bugula neritina AB1)]
MLSDLLGCRVTVPVAQDRLICGVQLDSRKVSTGDLFLALEGLTVHAMDYLDSVIESGVGAIVTDSGSGRPDETERAVLQHHDVPHLEIENLAAVAGEIAARFYGDPSRALKVIGVTGTDGKTSVCHMLGQAFNAHRDNCGVIGTLGWGISGRLKESGLTTPDAIKLQSALAEFRAVGAAFAAMEVSSHALVQGRVAGIAFDIAVLTNLGRDHLDYHGDMNSYRLAKEMLFNHPQLRAAVINVDDEFGAGLVGRLTDIEVTTFGEDVGGQNHIRYSELRQSAKGLQFTLDYEGKNYQVSSALIGKFNVQNMVATFGVLVVSGLSPELAALSLSSLQAVPGRMEASRLANNALVIVDYAHNPHALESVLKSVAEHVTGRLIVVFGCGGDRDQGKRPVMAAVAERYADACIVTDDNPRSENGDDIVQQILSGFENPAAVSVERNRKHAIALALGQAQANDCVVVAGKGHENYQLIGDRRLEFSDSEVVAGFVAESAL